MLHRLLQTNNNDSVRLPFLRIYNKIVTELIFERKTTIKLERLAIRQVQSGTIIQCPLEVACKIKLCLPVLAKLWSGCHTTRFRYHVRNARPLETIPVCLDILPILNKGKTNGANSFPCGNLSKPNPASATDLEEDGTVECHPFPREPEPLNDRPLRAWKPLKG